jgi:hypothetical protein
VLSGEADKGSPFTNTIAGRSRSRRPDLLRHACLMGLEGLVSKHREPVLGRSLDRWIGVKNRSHPAFSRVMKTC